MASSPSGLPCPPSTLPSPESASEPVYDTAHLDHLLTTYLSLLDSYTSQRDALSRSLSTGFFDLARAQRSSMLPPGQRYGEEMYDQRMKAERRVRVYCEEGEMSKVEIYRFEKTEDTRTKTETEKDPGKPEDAPQEAQKLETPPPGIPATSNTPDPSKPSPNTTDVPPTKATTPKYKRKPHDPLRWFGILTPQPLRSSQTSFVSALTPILNLINTSREMAELEDEIGRVRKSLGLDMEDESETVLSGGDEVDRTQAHQEADMNIPTPTSPKRRNLASRSKVAEPRSRVLKLGT